MCVCLCVCVSSRPISLPSSIILLRLLKGYHGKIALRNFSATICSLIKVMQEQIQLIVTRVKRKLFFLHLRIMLAQSKVVRDVKILNFIWETCGSYLGTDTAYRGFHVRVFHSPTKNFPDILKLGHDLCIPQP